MQIIEESYGFSGTLSNRGKTDYIVLHHSAGHGTPQSIHAEHLRAGYVGIGYHFYIRKDGSVYRGRPINVTGAHCLGYNSKSVGVCFEGNFENEEMTEKQKESGKELLEYLKKLYPKAYVKRHKDLNATLCPGKNFCFEEIAGKKTDDKEKETEETVMYYDWTTACPEWSIPYVQKALDLGIIKGDEQGRLRLTDDKIWCLVITLRAAGHMK